MEKENEKKYRDICRSFLIVSPDEFSKCYVNLIISKKMNFHFYREKWVT